MIYAQITKNDEEIPEIYLDFFGKDKLSDSNSEVNKLREEWREELLRCLEMFKNNEAVLFIDFNPENDKLISIDPILNFLAKKEFIPASKNLFYKK